MAKTLTIEGNNIHDIPSFYDEINRVFMAGVDWKLGQSLDALNDMFYGGYGQIGGDEEIKLIWTDFENSREVLGVELTKTYYEDKLKSPGKFNNEFLEKKLAELNEGTGQTYIDIILEIIESHPNIKLIKK